MGIASYRASRGQSDSESDHAGDAFGRLVDYAKNKKPPGLRAWGLFRIARLGGV
jgi:hypothetical protein